MKFMFSLVIFSFVMFGNLGYAQERPAVFMLNLADDHVAITTGFNGTQVKVFGTKVSKEIDPIIVLEGPRRDVVMRRKKRILGIWLNLEAMTFKETPALYKIAAGTGVLDNLGEETRFKEELGAAYLRLTPKKKKLRDDYVHFRRALLALKNEKGLYSKEIGRIENISDGFYKTGFTLPANLPRGEYIVRGYAVVDDVIIDQQSLKFRVHQDGVASDILEYAEEKPALYGIIGVLIAIIVGWGATQVLRRD